MPPEVVTEAPKEESKGDVAMDMIRDGLAERDRLRSERREEPKPDQSVETTETEVVEDKPETTTTHEEEPEKLEPETPDLNAVLEENARLKRALGKQGNEVGPLKAKLAELGEILEKHVVVPAEPEDPRDVLLTELKSKYGEDFANDLMRTAAVLTADLRGNTVLSTFREQIPDFKEYEPEMAKILQGDNDLREAVAQRPALLRTVYLAAKSSRLESDGRSAENKGMALAAKIAADKKAALAERPGGIQDKEPVRMSVHETGQKVLDDILGAHQDGRRR